MAFLLGVDGGNSKSIALVARSDGTILGWGRGGCGDIYQGENAALANITAAVETALQQAAVTPQQLAGGVFSMAGADWPEDFEFLRRELTFKPWGRGAVIVNDALGALRAGSRDGCGVAVVCGTYATNAARAPDGRYWHASFWHQETGGGVSLGRQALRAVIRTELGIDPSTPLTAGLLEATGESSVEDLLHHLTARQRSPSPTVASFARVLLNEAEAGDPGARKFVEEQGRILGDYALAAARKVGLETASFPLVFAGGVFHHPSQLLRQAITDRVQTRAPGAYPVQSRFEPVVGALLLALEEVGIPVNEALIDRLAETSPPVALFET